MKAVFVMLVLLAACGGDEPGAQPTGMPSTSPSVTPTDTGVPDVEPGKGVIALRVAVRADEDAEPVRTELTCTGDGAAGTGRLAAAAQRACDAARANRDLLVEGPPQDRLCTEIYGGPQVAEVAGTIDGVEVKRTFTRTNGCEIDDWQKLEPLLGPPPEQTD